MAASGCSSAPNWADFTRASPPTAPPGRRRNRRRSIKLPDDEEQATFLYELKGPMELDGATFGKDKPVEILNPGIKLATLMEDAHIDIEMQVDLGRGYVPSEVNEKYVEVVGTIDRKYCILSRSRILPFESVASAKAAPFS